MGRVAHAGHTLAYLALTLVGCGEDAEARYAGLRTLTRESPGAVGYRLRYLGPPWELIRHDPLVLGGMADGGPNATVQFGVRDDEGATTHADLVPVAGTATVLEIESNTQVEQTPAGVVTYPKYRLEVAVLSCPDAGVPVVSTETCAQTLVRIDEANRGQTELSGLFGSGGRDGENDAGQPYHEFMTQVNATRRFRRVVYFETRDRLLAIRLGFEANPALSETEVTRMVDAFEVIDAAEAGAGS